jgi:hypothetical protein
MTKIGKVSIRKRRSRQEIKRLVAEFETSRLRRSEFCQKHNLGLGTLQRGLRRRRMEVEGQSEAKRLVEVKLAGIQRNGSGAGTCTLEVVDLYNKLFHQHKLVPVPLPADAVCKAQQFVSADSWFLNP